MIFVEPHFDQASDFLVQLIEIHLDMALDLLVPLVERRLEFPLDQASDLLASLDCHGTVSVTAPAHEKFACGYGLRQPRVSSGSRLGLSRCTSTMERSQLR